MDRRSFLATGAVSSAAVISAGAAAAAVTAGTTAAPRTRARSRTWQIGNPPSIGNLQLVTRETPRPGRGEVLVRVVASSINARDRGIVGGFFPIGALKAAIPLSEGAGEIVELGADVSGVKLGDRVTSCHFPAWIDGRWDPAVYERDIGNTLDGWLTEYAVLPASGLVVLPDLVSYESAATLASSGVTA